MPLFLVSLAFLAMEASAATPATPGATLEIIPAWDAHFRPDRQTEVGVRLRAPRDGATTLRLTAKGQEISLSANLAAGETHTFWVPVRATADSPVTVQTVPHPDGQSAQTRQDFRTPVPPAGVLAVAVAGGPEAFPATGLPAGVFAFHPTADGLPRTSQAYATIDALLLDTVTLARLDREQLQALSGYLAQCGKLLAVDMAPQVLTRLRQAAACQARFVSAFPDIGAARATLASLLALQPPATPPASALRRLAAGASTTQITRTALISLFVFYFVLLLLVGAGSGRAGPLLGISLATACLVWLAGWAGEPEITVFSWAQWDTGDSRARYVALLSSEGTGPGNARLSLPAALGPPRPLSPTPFRQRLDDAEPDSRLTLDIPSSLFSRSEFTLTGGIAAAPPLSLQTAGGIPTVINHTDHATVAEGFLLWRGRWFPVPSLPPHQGWTPAATAGLTTAPLPDSFWAGARPQTRLFIRDIPAALRLIAGPSRHVGWLSIGPRSESAAL